MDSQPEERNVHKVAHYSFTIAHALRRKAQAICAHSK